MHDAITIGLPVFVILAGILFNRNDVNNLRSAMNTLRGEMNSRFDRMEARFDRRFDAVDAELRYFHGAIGKHEARLDLLEKR